MSELSTEWGPLTIELHKLAAECRQPINGMFELTARCNLSCRMCYIRHSAGDVTQRSKELTAEEWLDLARQAKDNGMVFLLLTGGEPFLRRDFFEIYGPLTRMGFVLTLFTNGTLITEKMAERLAQAPPSRTEITLYGATAATYEAITGVPGSYAACCAGIEALVSRGVPLGLKTTITRQNVHELEAMREMARNWGTVFNRAWLLTERRDDLPSDLERCRLSPQEAVALEASEMASAHDTTEAALRGPLSGENDNNFYCFAGKAAFVIGPSGEMNVCADLPQPAARPLEIGFRVAWTEVQRYVDSAPPLSDTCRGCDIRVFCGRCPPWSLRETGTLSEPSPYWCEIARARRELYGRNP